LPIGGGPRDGGESGSQKWNKWKAKSQWAGKRETGGKETNEKKRKVKRKKGGKVKRDDFALKEKQKRDNMRLFILLLM